FNKYTQRPNNENESGFNEAAETSMTELFQFYESKANEINSKIRATTNSYISIEIDSETENEAEEAELTLVYQVTGASWMPFYDIRVNTKSNPSEVTIYYYANVQQETGESWKNVELSLSTAQPCNNETLPKLGTTFVEFISTSIYGHNYSGFGGSGALFGNTQSQRQQSTGGGSLFGNPIQQPPPSNLFGSTQSQQRQQQSSGGGLFGSSQATTSATPRPVTPPPPPMKEVVSVAEENILSTTFTVSR
uniref:DUF4139 domain-containing protein n=1 Tax=Panagrolaimus sp. ES5 TaxID=591445 RepID=A0AC34GG28_9BILA